MRVIRNAARTVLLFHPNARGIFPGMPYAALNGSMWTIPYEFHCYILVMIVGAAGFVKGSLRYVLLVAVLVGLAFAGFAEHRPSQASPAALLGTLDRNLQLVRCSAQEPSTRSFSATFLTATCLPPLPRRPWQSAYSSRLLFLSRLRFLAAISLFLVRLSLPSFQR